MIPSYDSIELLKTKAISLFQVFESLKESISETEVQIKDVVSSISSIDESILVQSKVVVLFKELIDLFSREQIVRIQDLVTYALKTIFYDRDYRLEIEFGEYRGVNKTVSFYLIETVQVSESETSCSWCSSNKDINVFKLLNPIPYTNLISSDLVGPSSVPE